MGKAFKLFKFLLGIKTSTDSNQNHVANPSPKRKWSFTKSCREKDRRKSQLNGINGGNENDGVITNSVAVAAATATVAAAQAARALVHLTSSGGRNLSALASGGDVISKPSSDNRSGGGYRSRKARAAVTIQSHFRAYLSRRALRALKGLVKLQALVRGHLVRKQTAYALQRLQALVRVQARARVARVLASESPQSMKSSHFSYQGPTTPEKSEHLRRGQSMKHEQLTMLERNSSESSGSVYFDPEKHRSNRPWMESRMGERLWETVSFTSPLPMVDRNDKILEVDTGKLHSKRRGVTYASHHLSLGSDQNFRSFSTLKDSSLHQSVPSTSYDEVHSFGYVTDSSPALNSVSSKGLLFTPAKSDGTRSCCPSGYSDQPNYMANTQSSRAKLRSISAPRQRPHFDRSSSTKTNGDPRGVQNVSSLHSNMDYPGSGYLNRLGMPVMGDIGF